MMHENTFSFHITKYGTIFKLWNIFISSLDWGFNLNMTTPHMKPTHPR